MTGPAEDDHRAAGGCGRVVLGLQDPAFRSLICKRLQLEELCVIRPRTSARSCRQGPRRVRATFGLSRARCRSEARPGASRVAATRRQSSWYAISRRGWRAGCRSRVTAMGTIRCTNIVRMPSKSAGHASDYSGCRAWCGHRRLQTARSTKPMIGLSDDEHGGR
jgi:hypothetical protein